MQQITTQKGFSIGEVLVSSFVLLIGIVGSMVLILNNLTVTHDARDTIIAAQLAQEGVELTRSIRDNFVALKQDQIGDDLFNPLGGVPGGSYAVDYRYDSESDPIFTTTPSSSYTLELNGDFYVHSGGSEDTKFSRKVEIAYDDGGAGFDDDRAAVFSFVTWGGQSVSNYDAETFTTCTSAQKCAVATTTLTTWLGGY